MPTMDQHIERAAKDFIVRNNYEIQCLMREDRLKDALFLIFRGGVEYGAGAIEPLVQNRLNEILLDDKEDAVKERIDNEFLVHYDDIDAKNI